MRESIQFQLSQENGIPTARVSRDCAWDLVEFLANQRVQVAYTFEAARLVIYFHHMDFQRAQEILNTWVQSEQHEASSYDQPHLAATAPAAARAQPTPANHS